MNDNMNQGTTRGVCWGFTTYPTILDPHTINGSGSGSFISNMTGLSLATWYYVRSYATSSVGTSYGGYWDFMTLRTTPTLETISASFTSKYSQGSPVRNFMVYNSVGKIISDGGNVIHYKGFVINTGSTMSPSDITYSYSVTPGRVLPLGSVTTSINSQVTLESLFVPETIWHIRSIVEYSETLNTTITKAYGNEITVVVPSSLVGAEIGGGKSFYSGATFLLVASNFDQSSGGTWGCSGTLIGNTLPDLGVGDSNTISIISNCTESNIAAKICSELDLNGYTDWYLPSKDELKEMYSKRESIGGFATNDWQYYWSSTESGSTKAWAYSFKYNAEFIESKTSQFNIRAIRKFYFSNDLPSLTTYPVTSITDISAISGGVINYSGTSTISARGVCWSISSMPTTGTSHTTNNVTGLTFVSTITGLTYNTTHYVRAYATNSSGTAYGERKTFKTLTGPPIVRGFTNPEESIDSLTFGYTISDWITFDDQGISPIIQYGVCFRTGNTIPEYNDTVIMTDGLYIQGKLLNNHSPVVSIGESELLQPNSFKPNTTYSFRVFAKNSSYTSPGYGAVGTFTTSDVVVGLGYQGGMVFYVDPGSSPATGYISMRSDIGSPNIFRYQWADGPENINANGLLIGEGKQNTINMCKDLTFYYGGPAMKNSAAGKISGETFNGYSDWWLPSPNELEKMYEFKDIIGGFYNDYYWTSLQEGCSQAPCYNAYVVNFDVVDGFGVPGESQINYKTAGELVRAIRRFT